MKPVPKLLQFSLIGAALFGAVAASQAATVRVVFDSNIFEDAPNPDNVSITYPGLGVGAPRETAATAAGRFQGTVLEYSGVPLTIFVDGLNDLYMYCYDVYEHIWGGKDLTYTINLVGESARTLDFLGAVNDELNKSNAKYDQYAWLHPANGYVAAAIQLGIWESKYDIDANGWDLANGLFSATGIADGTNQTESYLSRFIAAIGSSASLDGRFVMTLENDGFQDMITGDPPGSVPEPGTLGLLAAAGLGLLAARRKTPSA